MPIPSTAFSTSIGRANTTVLDLAKMFNKAYKFNYESKSVGADESPAEVKSSEKYLGFKAQIKIEDEIDKIKGEFNNV